MLNKLFKIQDIQEFLKEDFHCYVFIIFPSSLKKNNELKDNSFACTQVNAGLQKHVRADLPCFSWHAEDLEQSHLCRSEICGDL